MGKTRETPGRLSHCPEVVRSTPRDQGMVDRAQSGPEVRAEDTQEVSLRFQIQATVW